MVHKVKSLKFESFIHTPFRATANSIEPPQKKVSIKRIFKGCSNKSKYKLTSEFKETPEKPEYMSEMLFNKVKSCKDSLVMIRACSAVELERFSTDEDESEESENSDEYEEYDEAGESEIEDLEYQTRDRKSKTVEDMEEHTFHIRNFLFKEKKYTYNKENTLKIENGREYQTKIAYIESFIVLTTAESDSKGEAECYAQIRDFHPKIKSYTHKELTKFQNINQLIDKQLFIQDPQSSYYLYRRRLIPIDDIICKIGVIRSVSVVEGTEQGPANIFVALKENLVNFNSVASYY